MLDSLGSWRGRCGQPLHPVPRMHGFIPNFFSATGPFLGQGERGVGHFRGRTEAWARD